MTLAPATIPYNALDCRDDGSGSLKRAGDIPTEAVAALLMHVIGADARAAAGEASVALVSATLDITGDYEADDRLSFKARIDRKTRTLVFTGGTAQVDGRPVLTATAIYRIEG
jgi:hypothetical protein